MVHKERVIVMSQLARLRKEGIEKDLKITHYYIEDYVYMKNFITRMTVLMVVMACIALHLFVQIQGDIIIPSSPGSLMRYYVLPYGVLIGVILISYTALSTKVYARRYQLASEKVSVYRALLERLDELDELDKIEEERGKKDGKRKPFNP